MNIWQFQHKLSKRLLWWSGSSVLVGFFLLGGGKFWRGVGWQFIGWGTIDAAIALFGRYSMNERLSSIDNPGLVEVQEKETRSLTRLLWINAVLDVFYIMGGKSWADSDKGNGERAGHGLGIVLQGAFLLFFDVYHALTAPKDK